jgi:hypothetical protein
VGFEHQVARNDHPHREARADRQRRRDVELTPDDLLACIVDRVLTAIADRLDQPVIIIGGEFGAD